MKKSTFNRLAFVTKWSAIVIINGLLSCTAMAKKLTIESVMTPTPISIDGEIEPAWQRAKPLSIILNELPYKPNNGYKGLKETTIQVRSLYDDEYIYLLYRWYDPTKDLARFPWEKQKDGSWQHLSNKDSTLHENTYYEDKLAIYWDINERGFIKKGCDKSCHMVENGLLEGIKDTSSGRHYTKKDSETIDEWQWKSIRTNPNNQIDDGFVDNEHETNGKWGRKADEKTAGGYYNNVDKNDKTKKPGWMNGKTSAPAPYWVLETSKVPFKDTFKPGDRIGGIVTALIKGSRGDVEAKGVWQDDHWQLEVKRKLVTHHALSARQDVQFNDLNKAYYFGVTAFDNSQINHLYHKKSVKLTFKH